ncbi:DNA polymerase epsilon subunit b protein [Cyclospora cayetanensis]|uniref:DNA polymerase epsilon subunit b protein n=1 Tax=Cyclospora cayetanensis TaxID=88456 RepID=A0A1D3D0I6_9EIME|nr:DNA polymerase epsilon subunit b protein [Cyclospora cayetanensis]
MSARWSPKGKSPAIGTRYHPANPTVGASGRAVRPLCMHASFAKALDCKFKAPQHLFHSASNLLCGRARGSEAGCLASRWADHLEWGQCLRGGSPRGWAPPPPSGGPSAEGPPSSSDPEAAEAAKPLVRVEAEEMPDPRFRVKPRRYQQQYAALYFSRLQQLKPHVQQAAQELWPQVVLHSAVKDIKPGEPCVVIGTLLKDMPMRPSVLAEYINTLEIQTATQTTAEKAPPKLFLEDATAKISLLPAASEEGHTPNAAAFDTSVEGVFRTHGSLNIDRCVAGMVVAVRGVPLGTGAFSVEAICVAGAPAPGPLAGAPSKAGEGDMDCDSCSVQDTYVALLSGLRLGSAVVNPRGLQLLRDFLLGGAPSPELRRLSSRIAKVVICGNCLALPVVAAASAATSSPHLNGASSLDSAASLSAALQEADVFLAQLAATVSLALMPGPSDPTTFALPQLPLHAALLPITRLYRTVQGVTNPHAFSVNGVRFIGSSGQPVDSICNASVLSSIEALELTAQCRCLAPTAPDSLACYPFVDEDPFCVSGSSSYHVFFAGLQKHHECRVLHTAPGGDGRAVVVSVPDFGVRGEIVLLSLRTLQTRVLRFHEGFGSGADNA